jgi:glycerate kinase
LVTVSLDRRGPRAAGYRLPMRVVLAPDKFKGSLSAPQVAAALAAGLAARPDVRCRSTPVADGGDGTVAAFVAAGWTHVRLTAPGPTGEPVATGYATRHRDAVVELAAICGLAELPGGRVDPLGAHTLGLGSVLGHALDRGARRITIGLGGSASTDGGAGMLSALGARITDAADADVPLGGAGVALAAHVDLTGLRPAAREATFQLACDVDNPLLGPHGAAAVYGPQKGASEQDVAVLEHAMTRWAAVLTAATGRDCAARPGAGAAGGAGFGALAGLGAVRRAGIEVVLETIGFADLLADADLVITGEGSLDQQSLQGKAPMGVLAAARSAGVPVLAVAGRCELSESELAAAGFTGCYTLTDLEPDPQRCIRDAAGLLRTLAEQIAATL